MEVPCAPLLRKIHQKKTFCRKVDKQIYFLSITLSLTVFTCWVINRIDIFDGFHYIHVVFFFDTQEIPVALVSVPCRRLRACDATPDAPCICGKPWARQRQRLRSCPSCRRSASRWPVAVLGPGARLPSALPLHLREWRCRLEVGAIIVLVLALARASPHHVSYAYARHPQTIGWGHRRGAHQQFRTHELERLVNRPREGCSRIAGTVGPQTDDGEEEEGHTYKLIHLLSTDVTVAKPCITHGLHFVLLPCCPRDLLCFR